MRTLITNGTVVNADGSYRADVLIDGETIAAVGAVGPGGGLAGSLASALTGSGVDRRIDASGKYVIPGAIDVHTHMELPFGGTFAKDTFETGTRAAAFGGTTTIVDFAVQSRGKSLREGLDAWHAKAQGNAVIDYGFHMIMSDVNDDTLAEMDQLVTEGVTDFKLFTAYPGVFFSDDGAVFRAMQRTARNGGLILMHAENGPAIDVVAADLVSAGTTDPIGHGLARYPIFEGEATNRVIRLAEAAGVPVYIVHLSARDALEAVRDARDRGANAFAETCPQYLFLSLDDLGDGFNGAKFVCSPPLRTADHQDELWTGLIKDDLQVVVDRSLPLRLPRPEAARARRLPQDPQRPAGRRGSPRPDARWRRRWRADQQGALGRDRLGRAGEALRARGSQGRRGSPAPTPTSSSTTRTEGTPSRPRRIT